MCYFLFLDSLLKVLHLVLFPPVVAHASPVVVCLMSCSQEEYISYWELGLECSQSIFSLSHIVFAAVVIIIATL